jgi:methionine synthase II (cobalamin-independent)
LTQYSTILTGIHPLSESLIKRIFDLKYDRVSSPDHVIQAFEHDISDLIDIQLQTTPEAISIGNLGWWDLFRPFARKLQELKEKDNQANIGNLPVTRIPLTNTFFRQPIISMKFPSNESVLKTTKHPYLSGNILQTRFLPKHFKNKNWNLCLPGPYTFSRAAKIDSNGKKVYKTPNDLLIEFSDILIEELQYLSSEGFSHVILDEGYFSLDELNSNTTSLILESWNQLASSSSIKIIIHTYHRLSKNNLESLIKSEVWGVGIDFIRNELNKVLNYDFGRKAIIAGVVDSQSYFRGANDNLIIESPKDIIKLGEELADIEAEKIILAPTSRLELIPRSVADIKVKRLGEAVKKLQKS